MSLNGLYRVLGISKQSLHQRLERILRHQAYEHQLLHLIDQVRRDHPTMCCRYMYHLIQPDFIGRDGFERFCREHGLMSDRPVNYCRTTDSTGVVRFENLTSGLKLTGINQLWVSDITYYRLGEKFVYLTFILDAFSRRILGHSTSARLFTEHTTLVALEMALGVRQGTDLEGLILHSDGGGQYYDKDFVELTQRAGIRNSMCKYPWDNSQAERINGVIKNNYLIHRDIKTFVDLQREVDRSVHLYNSEKPHGSLGKLTPITMEKMYLELGKTSDGEQSTTEYKTHGRGAQYSPPGCGKTSSGSHITPKYDQNNCLTVQ